MFAHRILAIDTATEICSVAVLCGELLTELSESVGNRHSERALPMIDAALSASTLTLEDIDVFAFGAGPGSFTGLRIACGITQGLAWGRRKRVVPVGNLRALAARAFASCAEGDRVLAGVDARMNEAYCAIYQRDEPITELRAPALERPQTLPTLATNGKVDIIAGNILSAFGGVWPADPGWASLPGVTPTAADIAHLARLDAGRGLSVEPENAMPIYVRDHVALTIDERKQAAAA